MTQEQKYVLLSHTINHINKNPRRQTKNDEPWEIRGKESKRETLKGYGKTLRKKFSDLEPWVTRELAKIQAAFRSTFNDAETRKELLGPMAEFISAEEIHREAIDFNA